MALQDAITEQAAAVLLGVEHVDQLPAAGDQFPEGARVFVPYGPRDGANGFGKERDDPRVERVGLGQLPSGRAKSRICRELTTATGSLAPASAAATVTSYPPVASRTTTVGVNDCRRAMSVTNPASSWLTRKESPEGRT
jgi:hypothetical protein